MTVKVSKSAINLRSKLNEIEKVSLENFRAMSGTFTAGGVYSTVASERAFIGNRTTTDGSIIELRKDNATVGSIGVSSTDNIEISATTGGGAGILLWGAGGTSPTISPMKEGTVVGGEVDLGRGTEEFRNLYLSGGVVFGDAGGSGTATSNSLDSYEEGTWTITVKDGTGNTYSSTYQNRAGRYTKVGRIVTVTFELYVGVVDLTSNGLTGNQAIVIAGLPFNSNSDQFTAGAVSNSNGINYTGDSLGLRIGRDTDEIEIITFSAGTGANDSPVTVTQFNNGNRLVYGTAVYTTA